MRLFIVVIVAVVLLCTVCAQVALADGKCMELSTTPAGKCWSGFETPVKFGGGWNLTVRGSNLGAEVPGVVQFSWGLNPDSVANTAGVWSVVGYMTSTIALPSITEGGGIWLTPDKSDTLVFVPAEGCDLHGQQCQNAPTSDKSFVASGILGVGYAADTPEALRGLAAPTVEMEYVPNGTVITVTRRGLRNRSLPVRIGIRQSPVGRVSAVTTR